MSALRGYQAAAVEAIRARYRAGDRATLVVWPTGAGKGRLIAEVCRLTTERGGRALVVAHREEILDQLAGHLRRLGVDAAVEQAARRAGLAQVVVGSVQTLQGRRLASWAPGAFQLVVLDEAHHALARTWQAIVDRFAAARVLGLTATPDRGDGRALGEMFESVAHQVSIRELIAQGYLVPILARRIVLESVDLSGVRTVAGDLATGQLAAVMGEAEALHGQAVAIQEQAGARPTLVFAVDVAHAHALAGALNVYRGAGWAVAIDGMTPRDERRSVLAAFVAGEVGCVVNCELLTEGTDLPPASCVAIARPTKSRALFVQMAGRGLRLSPETGKVDCLLLDVTGKAGRHRLVGPVDVLAGVELDDDVRAEALRSLDGEARALDDVLAAAEASVAEQRRLAGERARASYLVEHVDLLGPLPEADGGDGPATRAQVAALERHGVTVRGELSERDAARILEAVHQRRLAGLATPKQVKQLKRLGVEHPERVSRSAADRVVLALRNNGWRPLPRAVVAGLLADDQQQRGAA